MRRTLFVRDVINRIESGGERSQRGLNIEAPPPGNIVIRYPNRYTVPKHIQLCRGSNGMLIEWEEDFEFLDQETRPLAGILWRFLGLADASDENILAFTQQWGVLSLSARVVGRNNNQQLCLQEPLEEYRRFARQLRTILQVAINVREGKRTPVDDLRIAVGRYDDLYFPAGKKDKNSDPTYAGRIALCLSTHILTEAIEIFPRLHCHPDGKNDLYLRVGVETIPDTYQRQKEHPDLDLHPSRCIMLTDEFILSETFRHTKVDGGDIAPSCPPDTLYTTLVFQLIAALTSENGVYQCDFCGRFFESPLRKLRADRKRLCSDDCRQEVHRAHVRACNKRRALLKRK